MSYKIVTPLDSHQIFQILMYITHDDYIDFTTELSKSENSDIIQIPKAFDIMLSISDECELYYNNNNLGKLSGNFELYNMMPWYFHIKFPSNKEKITITCRMYKHESKDDLIKKYTNYIDNNLKLLYLNGSVIKLPNQ